MRGRCLTPFVLLLLLLPTAGPMRAQTVVVLHAYDLTQSLNDLNGGPALIAHGGTLTTTGYSFAAGQGLQLPTPLPDASSFTLVMDFSLDVTSGYRKIVDFQSLGPDSGFYNYYGNLNFYPVTTSSTSVIGAGQNVQVVLTRDSINSLVTGYVNGVQAISFTDSGNLSVFSSSANGLYFFMDDAATGMGEASGGLVSRILIFENPLTSAEVLALAQNQLPLSIPEPSTVWLLLIGAGVIAVSVCRRRPRP